MAGAIVIYFILGLFIYNLMFVGQFWSLEIWNIDDSDALEDLLLQVTWPVDAARQLLLESKVLTALSRDIFLENRQDRVVISKRVGQVALA